MNLSALFHPQNIAIIGASREEMSVGYTLVQNMIQGKFTGGIYPVNPKATEIQGHPCYPSVRDIPTLIDLAIIAIPAAFIPKLLKEIAEHGVKTAIIISAGFKEIGEEGKKLEAELRTIIKTYDMTIIGPNCLGVMHPHEHINATFAKGEALPGSIAIISQSGAVGSALLDIFTPKNIGLSHFISLGNKVGIDERDMLKYLETDEKTKVIGIYAEELDNATGWIETIRSMKKPVIMLKAGKTTEGSKSVASHTGSLAGEYVCYQALFKQAGIIEAPTLFDFVHMLIGVDKNDLPTAKNCAIITNAGGPGILSIDDAISEGLQMTPWSTHHNPWDLFGDAKAEAYKKALDEAGASTDVGIIMTITTPQTTTEIDATANIIVNTKQTYKKPIISIWMGEGFMTTGTHILEQGNVAATKYPECGIAMLKALTKATEPKQPVAETIPKTTVASIRNIQPLDLLKQYDIAVPAYTYVSNKLDLAKQIEPLGPSLAIKAISKTIIHKSDFGAVALNVKKEDAEKAFDTMEKSIHANDPTHVIDAMLYMDMVTKKDGQEFIIGIKRQPGLGSVIMVGLGGISVELYKDVAFRFTPMTHQDVEDMISELKAKVMFTGFRGKPALNKEKLIEVVLKVSRLAYEHPEIEEFDINPLIVYPDDAIAVDARVKISG